jgi:hypothetical protein
MGNSGIAATLADEGCRLDGPSYSLFLAKAGHFHGIVTTAHHDSLERLLKPSANGALGRTETNAERRSSTQPPFRFSKAVVECGYSVRWLKEEIVNDQATPLIIELAQHVVGCTRTTFLDWKACVHRAQRKVVYRSLTSRSIANSRTV